MSIDLEGTPEWMGDWERAKYAPTPFINCVPRYRPNHDTLTFVDRDPCPKCGVRKDHGCKHQGPEA